MVTIIDFDPWKAFAGAADAFSTPYHGRYDLEGRVSLGNLPHNKKMIILYQK